MAVVNVSMNTIGMPEYAVWENMGQTTSGPDFSDSDVGSAINTLGCRAIRVVEMSGDFGNSPVYRLQGSVDGSTWTFLRFRESGDIYGMIEGAVIENPPAYVRPLVTQGSTTLADLKIVIQVMR